MTTQATSELSFPEKQRQHEHQQNDTLEAFVRQLEREGYKVSKEYTPDEKLVKISGDSLKKTWVDYLHLIAIPLVLLFIGSLFTYQQNQTGLDISAQQHQLDAIIERSAEEIYSTQSQGMRTRMHVP